ncbi:MAG: sensor histidine kinase, partial [Trebonia sp.]
MNRQSPSAAPLRILRLGLHVLMAVLLAVVAVRASSGTARSFAAVLALVAALAAVYAAGIPLTRLTSSRRVPVTWLAVLTTGWIALLALTPDAVWLAFPLSFVQLHLLSARRGVAAVGFTTVLAISGFAWHQRALAAAAVIGPVIGGSVAVATVLGYQSLYRESERRRMLIEELTAARGELAAAEHAAGVVAERERLAMEIHDTIAQGLSSIHLLLRAAERTLPEQPEKAARHVRHARTTAQENLAEARRFVRALTPPGLDGGSLPGALERICVRTAEQSGLCVKFRLRGTPAVTPTASNAALLRIAQSALANIVRHAEASTATLTLSYQADRLALEVADDGKGFDPDRLSATSPS